MLLVTCYGNAQQLFYQNTYKGGVTADGVSYAEYSELQPDTINFQLHIPATSTVKKAFLFTLRHIWLPGNPSNNAPLPIKFNNNNLTIDTSTIVTQVVFCATGVPTWFCCKDVTSQEWQDRSRDISFSYCLKLLLFLVLL